MIARIPRIRKLSPQMNTDFGKRKRGWRFLYLCSSVLICGEKIQGIAGRIACVTSRFCIYRHRQLGEAGHRRPARATTATQPNRPKRRAASRRQSSEQISAAAKRRRACFLRQSGGAHSVCVRNPRLTFLCSVMQMGAGFNLFCLIRRK